MDAAINQRILSLYGLVETVPLGRFKQAAFTLVEPILPFRSGLWVEGEAETLTLHSVYSHNLPDDSLTHYLPYSGEDILYRAIVANPGRTFLRSDFRSLEEHLRSRFYREFGRRYDIAHAIATATVHADLGLYSFVSFYRGRQDPPYGERDRRIKQMLTPHLLTAYRIKLFQAILTEEASGDDSQAVTAIMDRQGVIHHAAPSLPGFLQEVWPDWRGPRLPAAVLEAIAAGRRRFFIDHLFFSVSTLPDGLILLRGRRMNRIEPLSLSESKVAFLLSQGWTYKEVGRDLGISPSTVTNHVNHIYRKLDIRSKSELRRFFRT